MQANMKLAGIEIGGTKLQLCIADASGEILHCLRYSILPSGGAEPIKKQIVDGLMELKGFDAVGKIGIGFGGPVDWNTGVIKTSHQVSGWAEFPLTEWLEKATGKSVVMDNDANVAALGEATQGRGKGFKRVFYITIGSGIGGGLVIDGKIYHGQVPGEMEIGHVRLDKNGTTLESTCSGWAVDEQIQSFISKNSQSLLAELSRSHSKPFANLLAPALDQHDEHAKMIISSVVDNLSFGLSHVVHLLHPDIIVVGGGLSLLGNYLLHPLRLQLPKYVMEAFHPVPCIELSAIGEQAVPLGAIELAKSIVKEQTKTANIQ